MKNSIKVIISLILTIVFILCLAGCNNSETPTEAPELPSGETSTEITTVEKTGAWADARYLCDTTLGNGKTTFYLEVKADEQSITFTINTDKTIVGDALLELGIIEGESSQYGLYVKKVNGMLADYDVDRTYWSLYINGDYAMSGVDTTNVEAGSTYTFERAK